MYSPHLQRIKFPLCFILGILPSTNDFLTSDRNNLPQTLLFSSLNLVSSKVSVPCFGPEVRCVGKPNPAWFVVEPLPRRDRNRRWTVNAPGTKAHWGARISAALNEPGLRGRRGPLRRSPFSPAPSDAVKVSLQWMGPVHLAGAPLLHRRPLIETKEHSGTFTYKQGNYTRGLRPERAFYTRYVQLCQRAACDVDVSEIIYVINPQENDFVTAAQSSIKHS